MLSLRDLGRFARTYLVLGVVLAVVGAAAGAGYTVLVPERYVSTTQVLFTPDAATTGPERVYTAQYLQVQLSTYAALARTSGVLAPAIAAAGVRTTPADLAADVTASGASGTTLLTLSVEQPSPALARRLADAVARSLGAYVHDRELATTDGDQQVATVTASSATPPDLPTSPASPSLRLGAVGGALAGLVLALVVALVHRRWRRHRQPAEQEGAAALDAHLDDLFGARHRVGAAEPVTQEGG